MVRPSSLGGVSRTNINSDRGVKHPVDLAWDLAGGGTSGTITTLTPDNWGFTSISGPNLNRSPGNSIQVNAGWTEPEGGFNNNVQLSYVQGSAATFTWAIPGVNSDLIGNGLLSDGQAGDLFGAFKLAFVDSAATSETTAVPDTGTTASLFGLSLTGLAFLRRKLS